MFSTIFQAKISNILKYFLSKTIHAQEKGSRGTNFAKFSISNFLSGLTYTLQCMPLLCPLSLTLVSFYLAQRPASTNARLRNFDFLSDANNWTLLLNICLLWGPLEAHSGDPINNLFWVQSKAKKTRLWRGAGGSQWGSFTFISVFILLPT